MWAFALRFYARPGVAAACLALQDEAGADVCLMLRLLHLATDRMAAQAASVAALDAAARPWREAVVHPLRGIRRWLRDSHADADALREAVKSAELDAERMLLMVLASHPTETQPAASPQAAAETSLHAYADLLGHDRAIMTPLLALFATRL